MKPNLQTRCLDRVEILQHHMTPPEVEKRFPLTQV